MSTKDKMGKDLWNMIKHNIPTSVILIIVLYVAVVIGGVHFYKVLAANNKLSEEYIQNATNYFIIALVVFTVIVLIVGISLYFWDKTHKPDPNGEKQEENKQGEIQEDTEQEKLPKGRIDAFIVEQDEPSRDEKFKGVNQDIKSTYWVLGVSLESIVERELTLLRMAKDNIKIRLCMMNPNIAVDSLCRDSITENICYLKNMMKEIKKEADIKCIDVNEEELSNCEDLLKLYHVLINAFHFKEYYFTETDYKERIKTSYDSLKRIKNSITKEEEQKCFELKVADSFMPMSLTITDADQDTGRMVVEFHLPFTQYKILFEIYKSDNKELFEVFVNFYNIIWTRAQND